MKSLLLPVNNQGGAVFVMLKWENVLTVDDHLPCRQDDESIDTKCTQCRCDGR